MNPQDILLISQPALEAAGKTPQPLKAWFSKNARTLPWREEPTPYHVWVSEIMLQQTRVEAVKGYYTRFLEALPTIEHLANVPEDMLLKLWEGLGYYNRARNLQKAAREVIRKFDGELPASYPGLLTLPGIGEYTAGAIASIAFQIPVPAVDGNVFRVFSRVISSYADITLPPVKAAYRQLLQDIVPTIRPGDFNQAVMELGATVCLPNSAPLCGQCPISNLCTAFDSGIALELPVKAAKKARRVEERTVIVVIAQNRILLFRRGGTGLLGGMYEPLNMEGCLSSEQAAEALHSLGLSPKKIIPLSPSKHIFSHVEWRMNGFLIYAQEAAPVESAVWADAQELDGDYAVPSAFRAYRKDFPLWIE